MKDLRSYLWAGALLAGFAMITGCEGPQPSGRMKGIPQITKLYEKATATPRVHRFRRPLRDEQARTLRQLSAECDQLLAEVRTDKVSAEALTGLSADEQSMRQGDAQALESALMELRSAATRGDTRALGAAHADALSAYTQMQGRANMPAE